jgi:hypothetical protein
LSYTNHSEIVAFADDFVVMVKADCIREAENTANVELSKILACAKKNKVRFNEQKSKANAHDKKKAKITERH